MVGTGPIIEKAWHILSPRELLVELYMYNEMRILFKLCCWLGQGKCPPQGIVLLHSPHCYANKISKLMFAGENKVTYLSHKAKQPTWTPMEVFLNS